MSKHTKEPWKVIKAEGFTDHLMGGDHSRIALLDDCHLYEEAQANARLIAAAPELLESLSQVLRWIDCGCDPSTKSLHEANEAVAKAEGGR